MTTTTHGLVGSESGGGRDLLLLLAWLVALLPEPFLHGAHSRAIDCPTCNTTVLEGATIEAWAVIIIALADDLAATDNDAAVAVVHWRLAGLLEAKREVIVRLHCGFGRGYKNVVWWVGGEENGGKRSLAVVCLVLVCCGLIPKNVDVC